MDPNSQPAPAATAAPAPTEPAIPAPAAPAPPAPAPAPAPAADPARTQAPVDHSQPAPPAADETAAPAPPADAPADPNAPPAPAETDAVTLASDVEADDLTAQLEDAAAKAPDGQLPTGVNPDGTIDPLVYAYEQMPTITVQGKDGKGGEVKTFTVKTADDLPDDFRFANAKEQAKFNGALAQNMQLAQSSIAEAEQHNEGRMQQVARREQLVSQKNEVDSLITAGKLPEMKLKPTDANFMQDPGAIRAQQVLDHMKEVNAANKAAGINQEITSVALGLQLLEAKEAVEARDGRVGTITDTRNGINTKISGGGAAPADAGTGNQQTVHKDVQSAMRAARRRHGI